jgi:hypothetical protein
MTLFEQNMDVEPELPQMGGTLDLSSLTPKDLEAGRFRLRLDAQDSYRIFIKFLGFLGYNFPQFFGTYIHEVVVDFNPLFGNKPKIYAVTTDHSWISDDHTNIILPKWLELKMKMMWRDRMSGRTHEEEE